MSQGAFLGLGNPLLDISADVEQAFLDKYGVTLNNAILAEDKHQPIFAELVKDFEVKYIAGGATLNSVRVAQWMSQAKGVTGFMGCIGKDKFGEQMKTSAAADGVTTHFLETADHPTGTCACLINSKERSLVTNLSAAEKYTEEHFKGEATQAVLAAAQFVYSAGFFLSVSPAILQSIGQHCADNNKTFAMNLSAPFISMFMLAPLTATIPFVDIMFGNESEAKAFGEAMKYEDTSVKNVALELSKFAKVGKKPRTVVITQGIDPTIVVCEGKVTEYPVKQLAQEAIVDANGAGDAFVGGFMSVLVKGGSVDDAVKAGHYASSVIIQVSGTTLPSTPPGAF